MKTGLLRSAFFKGKGTARSDVLGPVVTCGRYRFVCQSKCWPVQGVSEPGMGPGEATAPRHVGLQVPGSHGCFYSASEMVPNYTSVRPLLAFVPGRPPELFTLG